MRSRFSVIAATVLLAASFVFTAIAKEETIIDDSKNLFKEIQIFADAITLISVDYVKPIKVKDLVYGAIKGMMDTLDGYSQFLDPESFQEITEETRGEFGGIGIEIGMRDSILTVISPIEDTPAFTAGIEAGDRIVKIDGEVTREMTLDDAVKMLRGDSGTKVTLTMIREDNDKLLDFTITRAVIKLKSIKESKLIEGDIAYIKMVEFQERTADDIKRELKRLKKEGAKSLVLDLRNNPGGLLESAVAVSDLFLNPGEMIVYTEGRTPEDRMEFKSRKKPDFGDMEIAVLVNKGSASAAEILAGALMDNKRALTVGVTTFGKGSVQTVIPLKDESALRLTTAAYYTPSGKNLMDKGIEPDIYVKMIREKSKKSEEDEVEEKKAKVFDKVDLKKDKDKEKDPDSKTEESEKDEEKEINKYDNQMQTAVNVLKGIRIFEEYKTNAAETKGSEG